MLKQRLLPFILLLLLCVSLTSGASLVSQSDNFSGGTRNTTVWPTESSSGAGTSTSLSTGTVKFQVPQTATASFILWSGPSQNMTGKMAYCDIVTRPLVSGAEMFVKLSSGSGIDFGWYVSADGVVVGRNGQAGGNVNLAASTDDISRFKTVRIWHDDVHDQIVFDFKKSTGGWIEAQRFNRTANITNLHVEIGINNYAGSANVGYAEFDNFNTGQTVGSAPLAPTGVRDAYFSDSEAEISWNASGNNATGYSVYLKTGAGAFTYYGQLPPNTRGYQETRLPIAGLSASSTYQVGVKAFNEWGASAQVNAAPFTTPTAKTATLPSANVVASTGNTAIDAILGPLTTTSDTTIPDAWYDTTYATRAVKAISNAPKRQPGTLSGTVSVTNGSTSVVGVGTRFLSEMLEASDAPQFDRRLRIRDVNGTTMREVQAVAISDTQATLTSAWSSTGVSGSPADTLYFYPTDGIYNDNSAYYGGDTFAWNYYDAVWCLYSLYYRTGNTTYRDGARKLAAVWVTLPGIDYGRCSDSCSNSLVPRKFGILGMVMYALDGHPEMWFYLHRRANDLYDLWIGSHLNDPELYLDPRETGYTLMFLAAMAQALPDNYTAYSSGWDVASTGSVTDGAVKRSALRAKIDATITTYLERVQTSDGKYRMNAQYGGGNPPTYLVNYSEPFVSGLVGEALVRSYYATQSQAVKDSVKTQLVKLGNEFWYRSYFQGAPSNCVPGGSCPTGGTSVYTWRAVAYADGGGYGDNEINNNELAPNSLYGLGSVNLGAGWAEGYSDISAVRQRNATVLHVFGWLYRFTGDGRWKTRGDEVFDSMFGTLVDPLRTQLLETTSQKKAKDFGFHYRNTPSYLFNRRITFTGGGDGSGGGSTSSGVCSWAVYPPCQ